MPDFLDENGKFKKGHRRVGGMEKGYKFARPVIIEKLAKELEVRGMGKVEALEAMVQSAINKAINGDIYAFNSLLDRVDGRPGQDMNHKVEGTVIHQHVRLRDIKKK